MHQNQSSAYGQYVSSKHCVINIYIYIYLYIYMKYKHKLHNILFIDSINHIFVFVWWSPLLLKYYLHFSLMLMWSTFRHCDKFIICIIHLLLPFIPLCQGRAASPSHCSSLHLQCHRQKQGPAVSTYTRWAVHYLPIVHLKCRSRSISR